MKIFQRIVTTVLVTLAAACARTPREAPVEMYAPADVTITAEPQQKDYTFVCSATPQAKVESCNWVEVLSVKSVGDKNWCVSLKFSANDSDQARECEVVFTAGDKTAAMKIVQSGSNSVFSATSIVFSGKEKKTLEIMACYSWTLELTDTKAAPSWITVNVTSGSIGKTSVIFTTTEDNNTGDDRSCFARIIMGGEYLSVLLTQKSQDAIIADGNSMTVPFSGGEFSIALRSNVQYTIMIQGDWIRRVKAPADTKGFTDYVEKFVADPNPDVEQRVGYVTFTSGMASETVAVYQTYTDKIILGVSEMSVPSYGGNKVLDLRANIEFEIEAEPQTWLTAGLAENRVDRMVVSAAANDTPMPRSAKITVRGKFKPEIFDTVTVTQEAYSESSEFEKNSLGLFSFNAAGDNLMYDRYGHQTSVSTDVFRIIDPGNDRFIELSGLPSTFAAGDAFSARLVQNWLPELPVNSLRRMTVHRCGDGLVWLIDSEAIGYTIKVMQ